MESVLYQIKGCGDIELCDIFLDKFRNELRLFYKGYLLVPAPSYYLDDERRGFNHVEQIFSSLKMSFLKCITKRDKYKQSEQSKNKRGDIGKHLVLSHIEEIKNKKILIVDDVFTTGNTVRAIIRLIKPYRPKDIKVLVISKTEGKTTKS